MFIIVGFIVWVILCALVGEYWGRVKGLSPAKGFWLSIFLSPLLGFLIGLLSEPNIAGKEKIMTEEEGLKKCPKCAEFVKKEAQICRFCRYEFNNIEAIKQEADTITINNNKINEIPELIMNDRNFANGDNVYISTTNEIGKIINIINSDLALVEVGSKKEEYKIWKLSKIKNVN